MCVLLEIVESQIPFVPLGEQTKNSCGSHVRVFVFQVAQNSLQRGHKIVEVKLHFTLQIIFLIKTLFEFLLGNVTVALLVKMLEEAVDLVLL